MAPKQTEGVEFTGKSLEEALAAASQSLGIPVPQLSYQVVRDNTRTLFGLVRTGEVTVRVTVSLVKPKTTVSEAVDRLLSGSDWPARPARPADWDEDEDEEGEDEEWDEGEAEEEDEELTTETPSAAQPVTAVRGGDRAQVRYDEDEDEGAERPPKSAHAPAAGDLEAVATEVIATLLDKMGILAAVEIAEPAGPPNGANGEAAPLVLNLVGDDLGILIGRRGETLRDLQFVTRLIVSRRLGAWPNLVLDVEGYKSRRTTALRSLAKRMADQVRRTHLPVVLEPMPANERRIVHLALRDDPDVFTESTGEEEARKVQILPKRGH